VKIRNILAVILAAAAAGAAVTWEYRRVMQAPEIPPELAADVDVLKSAGWRPVRLCSLRCRHRHTGQVHVHVLTPWGDVFAFAPGQLKTGPALGTFEMRQSMS
jgi:hypothetical protein